jgi:glycosyltransferase involved in cell wall biosynthesis
MAMKVYINGRFLCQRMTGVQRYAFETLLALDGLLAAEGDVGIEFMLVAPAGTPPPQLSNIGFVSGGLGAGHLWEQTWLPWVTRDGLLLSFAATGPILRRSQVVTMHDAIVYAVPEAYDWRFRLWYRALMPVLARRVRYVVTVSEFSKRELVHYLRVPGERFRVIGNGWQHLQRVRSSSAALARHGLVARGYLLAVSSPSEHKNLAVIARALVKLPSLGVDVVVVGAVASHVFSHSNTVHSERVKLIGHVDDEELRGLYEGAAAFLFPSHYEGFGIPPLEAMAAGCPVIASTAAAIPEVCGAAALYFDPDDADELARRIEQLLSNEDARAALADHASTQLAKHDWALGARRHLNALRASLGVPSRVTRLGLLPRESLPGSVRR